MIRIPQLLVNPNFSLEVLMIQEEEVRRYDGKRNWRRKGWVTEERRLVEVVERRLFETSADWQAFVPESLELFTAKELSATLGISRPLAQKMAYCLRKADIIKLSGTCGREYLYDVVNRKK